MNTHDKIVKCRSCGYVGPCDPTCCEHPDYDGATAEEAWQAAIEPYAKRIAELEAARIAYASEFAPDGDGNPDVGSIHENIRKLKATPQHSCKETSQDREDAERYRWLRRSDTGPAKLDSLHNWVNDDCHPPYRELKYGKELDEAIDHARRIEGDGE